MTADIGRSIAPRLSEDPLFARVAAEISGAGPGEFYACGAYLLELAAGAPPGNMQVACRRPDADTARRIAGATGLFPMALGMRPGAYHLSRPGERSVTLVPMEGADITDHLGRTSFTVMAMAADAGSPGAVGLIDPQGGAEDLASGRLRAVSPFSISSDPARILLAADLANRFNLEPDEQTMGWMRSSASGVESLGPHRAWGAISRLYSGAGLSGTSRFLKGTGALGALFPELAAIYEVPQNYFHHLGVWEHTLEALDLLEQMLEDPSRQFKAYGGRLACYLRRPLAGGVPRRTFLAFGALIHDIGKAATMTVARSGRIRFRGHQSEGGRLALNIASRLGLPRRAGDHLAGIVRDHMALGFLIEGGESTAARLRCAMSLSDHCPEVVMLFLADRMATRGPAATAESLELYKRVATRLLNDWVWLHDYPPLVDGRDVMLHARTGPGPQVAEWLFRARVAQRESTVSSRAEALEYLAPDFKGKMG